MKIIILFVLVSMELMAQGPYFNKCMDKFPRVGDYARTHQLTRLCSGCSFENNWNEPFMCVSRRIRERGENEAVAMQKCAEKLKKNPSCNNLSKY